MGLDRTVGATVAIWTVNPCVVVSRSVEVEVEPAGLDVLAAVAAAVADVAAVVAKGGKLSLFIVAEWRGFVD